MQKSKSLMFLSPATLKQALERELFVESTIEEAAKRELLGKQS
jgi:hypothetical protein